MQRLTLSAQLSSSTQNGGRTLNESLNFPVSAFASTEAFDALCLEMQRLVRNAQR